MPLDIFICKSSSIKSSPKKLSPKKSTSRKSSARKSSLRKSITRKFSRSKSLNVLLNSEKKSISKKRRRPFSARLSRKSNSNSKSKSKSKSKSNEISFTLPPDVPGGTQNKKLREVAKVVIKKLRGSKAFIEAGKERQKIMQEKAVAPLIQQLNEGLEEYKKKKIK